MNAMLRVSRLLLVFAILFTIMIDSPAFLSKQFPPFPLIKYGDVFDLFTPLLLIPLYWLLFDFRPDSRPTLREIILFLVVAALWVEGQGMHLGANSIGHTLDKAIVNPTYELTEFYDEQLGHLMWHSGVLLLSALLLYHQWHNSFDADAVRTKLPTIGGIIYGITFFAMTIEGGTTLIGIPYSIGVALFALIWGRQRAKQQPILTFFADAHLLALLFFFIWWLIWHGFPQFSDIIAF